MQLETAGYGALAVIGVMTLATLITRWGGVLVMSWVPISERVRRFITGMSGSVMIALITPLAVQGDVAARVALVVTGVVLLVTKKQLPAIALGVLAAALVRQL